MNVLQLVIAYLQVQKGQEESELKETLQLNTTGVHTTLKFRPKGDFPTSSI